MQDSLLLEQTLNINGEIEFLLPDQSKVTANRARFDLFAEAKFQNLELKLEMALDQWELLRPFFDLQIGFAIQRFAMKPEPLKALLLELEKPVNGEAMLRASQGAMLCFDNYQLLGTSMWFEDEVENQV